MERSLFAIARTFFKVSILKAAVGVLIFAFLVEILQYFKIVEFLGLGDFQLAIILIGTSFPVKDFTAYSVGFLLILLLEYAQQKYKSLRSYTKKRSQYYNSTILC